MGQLEGQLGAAAKIVRECDGKVIPAADVDAALRALRYGGSGIDRCGSSRTTRHIALAQNGVAPSEPATRVLIGRTVFDVEHDLILDMLDYCLGNRPHAANILGISVRTLRHKLRDYAQADLDMAQPGTAMMAG